MSNDLLQCYNTGCGKKYKEEENSDGEEWKCWWVAIVRGIKHLRDILRLSGVGLARAGLCT